MNRFLRISGRLIAWLLLILLLLWLLLQMPAVQNWLVHTAAKRLSRELQTEVSVGRVDLRLLNRARLQEVLVKDRKADTLAYIGRLDLNITDWFPLRDRWTLHYLGMDDVNIHLQRKEDSVWNYQFLVDYFGSGSSGGGGQKPPDLDLQKIDLTNIHVRQLDLWKGYLLILGLDRLKMRATRTDLANGVFDIDYIDIEAPEFREIRRRGYWSAEDSARNRQRLDALYATDTLPPRLNAGNLQVSIGEIRLNNGTLEFYNRQRKPSVAGTFDERDIIIDRLTGNIRSFKLLGDTITANVMLKAHERSGIDLHGLSTRFRMQNDLMEFSDLDLRMNNSRLGPYYAMHYRSIEDMEDFVDKVHIEARINNGQVDMQDIAFFAPELKDIRQTGTISGLASGTISDFRVRNLDLRTGRSRMVGDYSMRGLTDIDRTIIRFQTGGSQIALEDVEPWAPDLRALRNTPVGRLGLVRFNGYYEGTPFDFFIKGQVGTDVGSLSADFKLKLNGPGAGYTGIIRQANLDGGKLLGVPALGRLVFNGKVGSTGFSVRDPLKIEGSLSEITYSGYKYQDIALQGVLQGNKLNATMQVDDEHLAGNITTVLDFNEREQRYNARGYLARAHLRPLGFTKDSIRFAGSFDVDFRGKSIDDFLGYGRFYNGRLTNGVIPLSFDSLLVESTIDSAGNKRLVVQTNEAAGSLEGRFKLSALGNSFRFFLHRYYPVLIKAPTSAVEPQEFAFELQTGAIEPFLRFLDPNIGGLEYSNIIGSLNTETNQLLINAEVPSFRYDNFIASSISLRGTGDATDLSVLGSIDNLQFNENINLPNAVVRINTELDTTRLTITTATQGPLGNAAIDAEVYTQSNGFEVHLNESSFIVNNKKWLIENNGMIQFKDGYIISNGVTLSQDRQVVRMFTVPSEEGNWNDLHVAIKDLNMGDFLPLVLDEPKLEGEISGTLLMRDPLGKFTIDGELGVEHFWFNSDSVGRIDVSASFDSKTNRLKTEIDSRNPGYDFGGLVNLDFSDSAKQQIDSRIVLRNERVRILEPYLGVIFDQIDGYASGNLQIVGPFAKPAILGKVLLKDANLLVEYTKCRYFIDTATLLFGDNYIDLGRIQLRDERNRTGRVEGIFYHRFFDSLSFNIRMRTEGMQVLNTNATHNDLFYGRAVARATFDLTGPLSNLNMRITGVPTDSSWIAITNKEGKASGEADFIVFRQYGKEMEALIDTSTTNIHINLDLTANPLCRIDVVLDDLTGDVISARGSGNLNIRSGTVDPTTMRGRFVVEQGSYNYTFQSLIRKPFDLSGDNNFIEWSGDPMDANMNISAMYVARDVSLRDLISSENANTVLDQDARNYKGDVHVIARLRGKLSSPVIDFDIEFPPGSVMRNNLSALDMMRRIREDKSEMLKQVTYLIVFRSFAPYKQGSGLRNPGTDLAVNTISELVSREMGKILTNVIHEITGDQSLTVDLSTNFYNSSQTLTSVNAFGQYDRVNVNFNLNRSYFNNRVVVNVGSDFDVNVRNTAVAGFQFLPDVSVEFILTPNRRLRAILFKRDNLDIAGRRNRAGASISYRKDFDRLFGNKDEESLFIIGNGRDDENN